MGALSFTRSMRWNGSTAFSRPVRWLLALHGSTVLPFSFAGLQAGGSHSHGISMLTVMPQLQSTASVLHISHLLGIAISTLPPWAPCTLGTRQRCYGSKMRLTMKASVILAAVGISHSPSSCRIHHPGAQEQPRQPLLHMRPGCGIRLGLLCSAGGGPDPSGGGEAVEGDLAGHPGGSGGGGRNSARQRPGGPPAGGHPPGGVAQGAARPVQRRLPETAQVQH